MSRAGSDGGSRSRGTARTQSLARCREAGRCRAAAGRSGNPLTGSRTDVIVPGPVECLEDRVLIDIVVYDGFDELDVIGPLEVLRNAAAAGAELHARLVTRTAQDWVTGCSRVQVAAHTVFEPREAEIVVVPGGGWTARALRGAWGEVGRGDWLPLLVEARSTVRVLAGVCTGTMLLAHAGLVGGRRASTHSAARADLAASGAVVLTDRVVDDGDLVTSGGVTSGIDLALWLVEREISFAAAEGVAERIEYRRFRPSGSAHPSGAIRA
jgi:transcriptional regulator GlxA family with amidase domain